MIDTIWSALFQCQSFFTILNIGISYHIVILWKNG